MDTSDLKAQCMGLHSELEAMTIMENKLKEEKAEILERLKSIHFNLDLLKDRKVEYKKLIEVNLDQQDAFGDELKEPDLVAEELSALEDYLLDPNRSIKSIADKHGISDFKLGSQITEHFKVSA